MRMLKIFAICVLFFSLDLAVNAQNGETYNVESRESFNDKVYSLKIRPIDQKTSKKYPEWASIDAEHIKVYITDSGPVLIQFNAVDTWNDGGVGTWYAIEVNGKIVTQTIAYGFNAQRVPVTLSTIENLSRGDHIIKTKWCTERSGGTSFMGGFSSYQLMAIKLGK